MIGEDQDGSANFAYQSVYRYLSRLIMEVEPGARFKLPSLRELGRQLGVSVSTVQTAYGLLETEGRIESVARSGYFALGPVGFGPALASPDLLLRMLASGCQPNMRVFSHSAPPALSGLIKPLLKLELDLVRRYPSGLAGVQPCGEPELRRALAARYTRGLQHCWGADDVYVGTDLACVLEMVCEAMQLKGAIVLVLVPCAWRLLRTLRAAGAQVLEVPLDVQGTVPIQRLQLLLRQHRVRLAVLPSTYHWPCGVTVDEADRRTITRLLDYHGTWVLEDDTLGDLCFKDIPRLRELVNPDRLLVCGSLQHVLGSEASFAYLLSRHWRASLQYQCLQRVGQPPALRHKALARLIGNGLHDTLLSQRLSLLRSQVEAASARQVAVLGEHVLSVAPTGGAKLWLQSSRPVNMRDIFESLRRQKLLIAPGDIYSLVGHCQQQLFINAAGHEPAVLEALFEGLAEALWQHRL